LSLSTILTYPRNLKMKSLEKSGKSTSSVKRAFSVIKAIVNLAISKLGLNIRNVFSGIYLPEKDVGPDPVFANKKCIYLNKKARNQNI